MMKEYELTDKQIEIGKSNPLRWMDCVDSVKDVFRAVGLHNVLAYQFSGVYMGRWREPSLTVWGDSCIYRIKPDYVRPKAPVPVEDRWLEADVIESDGMYAFNYQLAPGIYKYMYLDEAPRIVGFGGVRFKDGLLWSPALSGHTGDVPRTPEKVRFENRKWPEQNHNTY